jgi:hypothetical protein
VNIIAIDPGPTASAFVVFSGSRIEGKGKRSNEELLHLILVQAPEHCKALVIEKIASYGMPVGAEVFETVYWSGRFAQAFSGEVHRVERLKVKMHLCRDSRAKDGNIRQALIDRFGTPGTKKAPGALYGVSGDVWAALAVAVTWYDANIRTGAVIRISGVPA